MRSAFSALVLSALFGGTAAALVITEAAGGPRSLSARSSALAATHVADLTEPAGMFLNPAVLPFAAAHPVSVSVLHDWSSETMNERASWSGRIGAGSAVGIGLGARHAAVFRESSAREGLSFGTLGVDGAFGWKFSRFWSLGIAAGAEIPAGAAPGPAFSGAAGILYSPAGGISYGLAYSTFNTGLPYVFTPVDKTTQLERSQADHGLEVGVNMRHPLRTLRHALSLGLGAQRVFGRQGILYRAGMEWYALPELALRFGFVVLDGTSSERYGAGLHVGPLRADYAIAPSRTSGRFHELTVTLSP